MRKEFYLLVTTACTITTFFCSCTKNSLHAADEVKGTPLPGQDTYCRIESIWVKNGQFGQEFRTVGYDEYENPTFITNATVATGSPYRTFVYDQWHRLREYRESYSYGNYQAWHLYAYGQDGRIHVDTTLNLGNTRDNYAIRSIANLEYDNQGRIIRESGVATSINWSYTFDQNYAYDASGNLIRPGVTYDNRLNINRTNDIWMFISRDYSLNNPFIADEYNAQGYPTRVNMPATTINFLHTEVFLNQSEISYGCRQAYW
jgi:hypothetical protein